MASRRWPLHNLYALPQVPLGRVWRAVSKKTFIPKDLEEFVRNAKDPRMMGNPGDLPKIPGVEKVALERWGNKMFYGIKIIENRFMPPGEWFLVDWARIDEAISAWFEEDEE